MSSSWIESNETEFYAGVAKVLGEFYGDRLLTFSPEKIKNIEDVIDDKVKIFGKGAVAIYGLESSIYYGEIIRRAIGGEWRNIFDFSGSGLTYIRYESFLIHPGSEIVWMVKHGWKNHLQKFYKNVINEIGFLKELDQKGSSLAESEKEFYCIFPDRYLDYITEFREYERQKNIKNDTYLGLSISELNKAHKKR